MINTPDDLPSLIAEAVQRINALTWTLRQIDERGAEAKSDFGGYDRDIVYEELERITAALQGAADIVMAARRKAHGIPEEAVR